jgi:hypothetical protein
VPEVLQINRAGGCRDDPVLEIPSGNRQPQAVGLKLREAQSLLARMIHSFHGRNVGVPVRN